MQLWCGGRRGVLANAAIDPSPLSATYRNTATGSFNWTAPTRRAMEGRCGRLDIRLIESIVCASFECS